MGVKLLLDCDPGHDDAIALLAAVAFGELVGVTTVAGNCDVGTTTSNARAACQVFGYGGEIVGGAARPLLRELGAFSPMEPFPPAATDGRGPSVRGDIDAAGFIVERADAETWLVTTGPMTNAALALRRDADLVRHLAGISVMGGSATVGNVTPVAEFNVWSDPEAAHIVLTSGLPIRMCGLHVTHDVLVGKEFVREVRGLGTRAGQFTADLIDTFIETYPDAFVGEPHAPLHDVCAVLAVTHPHLFEWQSAHAAVELTGTLTRGMTVIDQRDASSKQSPNVQLARRADPDGILETIRRAVEAVGGRAGDNSA
ncbi:MAG TPA: nucleoside hydrolase [Pyrinomonadaceae bacterium]|jgi:inosine-uridine nucleoside N-ribohydrolase